MRSQRERDILRDIKLSLKSERDTWEKACTELVNEYRAICPTRPDVMYDIGVQAATGKERRVGERAFMFVAQRGSAGGNVGDLNYASALVQLAILRFVNGNDAAVDETYRLLGLAEQYAAGKMKKGGGGAGSGTSGGAAGGAARSSSPSGSEDGSTENSNVQSPQTSPTTMAGTSATTGAGAASVAAWTTKWENLRDFIHHSLGMCAYLRDQMNESSRHFDGLSSYQLVLDPPKYALLTLVKALTFIKLAQKKDALNVLKRRQSQEESLLELRQLSPPPTNSASNPNGSNSLSSGNVASPPASPKKPILSDPIHLCHNLHIALLSDMDEEDEASELFKRLRTDYNRGTYKAFIASQLPIESVGRELIASWVPTFPDLNQKRGTQTAINK